MRTLTACLALTAMMMTGCATLHRKATYSTTGAADLGADLKILEEYKKVRAEPLSKGAESVTVFIDTMPEGIDLKDTVVSVEDGYQHQILGKFTLNPEAGFFPSYTSNWRKPYCYPQQILVVGTLFLWGLVPIYYPCYATTSLSKAELLDAAKQLAYEAGGDLVLASYGPMSSQTHASTLNGFIVKADPRFTQGQSSGSDAPGDGEEGGLGIMNDQSAE